MQETYNDVSYVLNFVLNLMMVKIVERLLEFSLFSSSVRRCLVRHLVRAAVSLNLCDAKLGQRQWHVTDFPPEVAVVVPKKINSMVNPNFLRITSEIKMNFTPQAEE